MTTPEARARQNIDTQLTAYGWLVQDRSAKNLLSGRGVAVREFPLKTGYADYLLFVDRGAAGIEVQLERTRAVDKMQMEETPKQARLF